MAVLFVAAMLAHIYIGTIGMEGAFEAMGTGTVDVNWAREHHSLWLEEQNARDRCQRCATAAGWHAGRMSPGRPPVGGGSPLSSEPHACRCKGLVDGFLDLVEGDRGNCCDHDGNRTGK